MFNLSDAIYHSETGGYIVAEQVGLDQGYQVVWRTPTAQDIVILGKRLTEQEAASMMATKYERLSCIDAQWMCMPKDELLAEHLSEGRYESLVAIDCSLQMLWWVEETPDGQYALMSRAFDAAATVEGIWPTKMDALKRFDIRKSDIMVSKSAINEVYLKQLAERLHKAAYYHLYYQIWLQELERREQSQQWISNENLSQLRENLKGYVQLRDDQGLSVEQIEIFLKGDAQPEEPFESENDQWNRIELLNALAEELSYPGLNP